MDNLEIFNLIDQEIRSGKFSRFDEISGIGDPKTDYHKCNIFINKAAKLWGVDFPKMKHSAHSHITFAGGDPKDWPENPIGMHDLRNYFGSRAGLKQSGVQTVSPVMARNWANKGKLVLAIGQGHVSIAAPNKKKWPLVFRPDLAFRGEDQRTKVGVRNKGKDINFYKIEPSEYMSFNDYLKNAGLSERDIHSHFTKDSSEFNENYFLLQKRFSKNQNKMQ